MTNILSQIIKPKETGAFRDFIASLSLQGDRFMLRNDILLEFEAYCRENNKPEGFRRKSSLAEFINGVQELFVYDGWIAVMHRNAVARYSLFLVSMDGGYMEEIGIARYLKLKDMRILGDTVSSRPVRIDIQPFNDYSPVMRDARNVGNGIRFLSRFMCSKIFQDHKEWDEKIFEFIKLHKYMDRQLLVNGAVIGDFNQFMNMIEKTIGYLSGRDPAEPFASLEPRMKKWGLEPGWGDTAGRILETMRLLVDLINEPTDAQFEEFISRVPMPFVSKIAVISPHGWFGQEHVLGRPDTGGQVIYILDQVRALERYLKRVILQSGLDVQPHIIIVTRLIPEAGNTSCNQRKEKVRGADNAWILRVPFRDDQFNTIREWISRFHIWPYLESFADDAARELLSEFKSKPDLIIGNYSDGNLVASLMSDALDVIQCTIAHALEKTKYLFSDLYWRDMEERYNFSIQFTADLLAMNKADFVIASTYQEIAGTEHSMGQYESYQFFTMPGLYQVVSGINIYSPKFNVIPPGIDPELYFPYTAGDQRVRPITERLESLLISGDHDDAHAGLEDQSKPPIFIMSRFDRIKNITGLIEAYGMSEKLQTHFNLVIAAGAASPEDSLDDEERDQMILARELIDRYALHGKVRWLPCLEKRDTGEAYRIIADRRGIFVQPALFEAFGLTILEAMASGLPTFGPQFGGPREIIEDGKNGFLLNTSRPELIARGIEEFLAASAKNPGLWEEISRAGVKRVEERFTWEKYSDRLVNLTKLYGFWRYSVSGRGKIKMDHYCDILYNFLIRDRAKRLIDK